MDLQATKPREPRSARPASPAVRPAQESAEHELRVVVEAVGIHWRGMRLDLSPAEARLLSELLEQNRASWQQLTAALGRDVQVSTLRVFIWRVRRKLSQAGVPYALHTHRGWGVSLERTAAPMPGLRPS